MLFRPFDSSAVTASLRLKIHGLNDPRRIQVGGGDEALDVVSTESFTGCCSPSLVRGRGGKAYLGEGAQGTPSADK